eukprot:287245-Amphidinium_carterae.1
MVDPAHGSASANGSWSGLAVPETGNPLPADCGGVPILKCWDSAPCDMGAGVCKGVVPGTGCLGGSSGLPKFPGIPPEKGLTPTDGCVVVGACGD